MKKLNCSQSLGDELRSNSLAKSDLLEAPEIQKPLNKSSGAFLTEVVITTRKER